MKLIKVRITNFLCTHDSGEFDIDDVICLVGKNQSGKTAILKALYNLNPIDGMYPRLCLHFVSGYEYCCEIDESEIPNTYSKALNHLYTYLFHKSLRRGFLLGCFFKVTRPLR